MLFEPRLRQGLADGSITLAFRRWRRAQVVAGHHYRTGTGMVAAEAVDVIAPDAITDAQARAAGYADVAALTAGLRGDPALPLYLIRFRWLDEPDPRDQLAAQAALSDADAEALSKRLARMDAASSHGPWTAAFLAQIGEQAGGVLEFLAQTLGWDRPEFKIHVRRLKALGLTISLDVGYRLSPRGQAYLTRTQRS